VTEDKLDDEQIKGLLQGKTMQVYALLLTHGQLGVREIQRMLAFSSPSVAAHHLSKLMNVGLVTKDNFGDYYVLRDVRVGSLTLFVRIGRYFLPRFVFQITIITGLLLLYLLYFLSTPVNGSDVMFIALCIISITFFVYEAYKLWLLKPI
jgi:hypothetical protein